MPLLNDTAHSCVLPGYQIIGDNVDFLVKAKHMSSTKQNESVHWFNLNGILDRVTGQEYSNEKLIKSISKVENIDFLPSAKENQDLLHDLIPLLSRVVVYRIPAFVHSTCILRSYGKTVRTGKVLTINYWVVLIVKWYF